MPMMCPTCGAENPDHATFCNLCHSTVGFVTDEYVVGSAPAEDGYSSQYPSSFSPDAPVPPPDPNYQPQVAHPVDIGTYGQRSGEGYFDQAPQQPSVPPGVAPADIGQYGERSGYQPWDPGVQQGYHQGYAPSYERSRRTFDLGKAALTCLGIAAFAAVLSVGLEILFSIVGLSAMIQGSTTAGWIWIMLAFLIPVCLAGFMSGYRVEVNGWAVGLATVAIWAFAFRPLYYAILGWVMSGRFSFASLFNRVSLAFIFFLFLPLGALMGWLGEKRATTGLRF